MNMRYWWTETYSFGNYEKPTYARNALNWNLPYSFLKTGKPRIDFSDLSLLSLYQLLDDLWWTDDNGLKEREWWDRKHLNI